METPKHLTALTQEWAVFQALCPDDILALVQKPTPNYGEYTMVYLFLRVLGFHELSTAFYTEHSPRFPSQYNKTLGFLPLEDVYGDAAEQYNEVRLIRRFVEHIKSPGLRDLFDKKADYFY